MKQLKKISLQKEELMSLNLPQMDLIRGGVSAWNGKYGDDYYIFVDVDPYGLTQQDYILDSGMNEYSSQWAWSGDGSCLLTEVVVTP